MTVRKVDSPPVGKDGLFTDTGTYDEVKEAHRRKTFAEMFQYADPWCGNPRVYDPNANYLCGDCNKFVEGGECLAVEGAISATHGSCRHWEDKDAGDPELKFAEKISKEMADYGETPNAGFGCHRCEYHEKSKAADSHGRDMFCKQGAFRILHGPCCALNDTPGMVSDFPDSDDDDSTARKALKLFSKDE